MTIAIIVHVIGAVLGVGAVTINDVQFLRAIGDGELGVAYQRSTRFYSGLIWIGWLLLVGSAAYFALTQDWVLRSEKIQVKILLLGILTINGLVMGARLIPSLHRLTKEDWATRSAKLRAVAKASVFMGALSMVTWYTTLILGAAGHQPWTTEQMLGWYLVAVLGAWGGAAVVVQRRLHQ